jgi:hypothetical protein
MRTLELKKCIIDLAFTTQSEAAFVSCYIPLGTAFARNLIEAKPSGEPGRAAEAFEKIVNFVPLCAYPPAKSVAAFARVGAEPHFVALPLAVPLAPHVAVGPLPEIYRLLDAAARHEPFVFGVCEPGELRILFVDLGTIVRETRVEGTVARRAAVLEQAVRSWPANWFVTAGAPREIARICDASSERVLRKLAGTVPDDIQRIHDAVQSAATVVNRRREQISRERVRQLSRDWAPSGSTLAGPVTTLLALAAGVADTIWLAADCLPQPAVICGDCTGVEWKLVRPVSCMKCETAYRYPTDSREQIVRQALRQGCSIEMLWEEGTLAQFGGVACKVRRPSSGWPSDAENWARRLADYGIRMRTEASQQAAGSRSTNHQQVCIQL